MNISVGVSLLYQNSSCCLPLKFWKTCKCSYHKPSVELLDFWCLAIITWVLIKKHAISTRRNCFFMFLVFIFLFSLILIFFYLIGRLFKGGSNSWALTPIETLTHFSPMFHFYNPPAAPRPPKTSENLCFFNVFRSYRNETLDENGLTYLEIWIRTKLFVTRFMRSYYPYRCRTVHVWYIQYVEGFLYTLCTQFILSMTNNPALSHKSNWPIEEELLFFRIVQIPMA